MANELNNPASELARLQARIAELENLLATAHPQTSQHAEREALALAFFENAPDAIMVADDNGNYLDANKAACELFGVTKEKILTLNIVDFGSAEGIRQAWQLFLEQQELSGEFEVHRPDGQIRFIDYKARANFLPGRHVSIMRDITKHKTGENTNQPQLQKIIRKSRETEAALQASQLQYAALIDAIDAIVWEVDVETQNYSFISSQVEKILGYSAAELQNNLASWSKVILPTDRARFWKTVTNAITTRQATELEYAVTAADKRIVWLRTSIKVVAEKDKPLILRGISVDITSLKEAEADLKEQQALYQSIFEASSDGMFIYDLAEEKLVAVNSAGCRILGYSREELLQMSPLEVIHPEYQHLLWEEMAIIRQGGTFRTEALNVRRDGTPYPVEVFGTSLIYHGKFHALSVVHDISERVAVYQRLEHRVQERTHEITALLEISRLITATTETGLLVSVVLDALKQLIDYHSAAFILLEGNNLKLLGYRPKLATKDGLPVVNSDNLQYLLKLVQREPIVIADIHSDSLLARALLAGVSETNLLQTTAQVHSWMAVPILNGEKLRGLLTFTHQSTGYFNARQAEMVMTLASQIAVVLANIELYQQAQTLAVLEERQRIARDLHDSVTQVLYGIVLGAKTAQSLLERQSGGMAEPISYILEQAELALNEMRTLVLELRPEVLEAEGLVVALRQQAKNIASRYQLKVQTDLTLEPEITIEAKEGLYRIGQEALYNIVKHAHAQQITISLKSELEQLQLEICDDGVGFNPNTLYPGHLGLQTMRERAVRLGGELKIVSKPGKGTCVQIKFSHPTSIRLTN